MGQLFLLLAIVLGTYLGLTVFQRITSSGALTASLRGRISISVLLLFTGVSHFVMTASFVQMLPAFVPFRVEVIYVTGVLEILGAIGLLIPRLRRLAAAALIVFLLAVLPANIYAAFVLADVSGHAMGPVYLLARVPFQLFLIWWIYTFGIKLMPASPAASVDRRSVRWT